MKHRHFTQAARRLTALTLALLLALPSAYAAAGSPQLRTTRELADGLTYSNTITSHSAAGRVESFSLELSPDSREVEPIFLQASGTAYGAGSINLGQLCPEPGLPRAGRHQYRLLCSLHRRASGHFH